jgi:hypothetical protein
VIIIIAWFIGANRAGANILSSLNQALPEAASFEHLENDTYLALDQSGQTIGYVSLGEAVGYGGPMEVTVAINDQGEVIGFSIASHKETPSFLNKVIESDLIDKLLSMNYQNNFVMGEDVDSISGATYTSRAIIEIVREETWAVASKYLGYKVPSEKQEKIIIGVPEITVIALFLIGFVGHQRNFKYKKQMRWVSMIGGMVILGFIFNRPLTISYINQLLLGYLPSWRTNLYWYLLLGGIFFVFTVDNKNPYCEWFCPFGSAQECMGLVGGAKPRSPGQYKTFLTWLTRLLALSAIVIALLFRNPGITSYEIFGTLFSLTGTSLQFVVLGIILVSSLFIRRPWCTYLCPLRPVTDFYRIFRKRIFELWRKIRTK